MHRCICGLYAQKPSDPTDTLNDSWQRRIVRAMLESSPHSTLVKQFGNAWVLEFSPDNWESTLLKACTETGVELRRGSRVTALGREQNRIVAAKIGDQWLDDVDAVIDCTGGGHVLRLAGSDTTIAPESRMLAGFSCRLANITSSPESLRLQVPYAITQAVAAGELPPVARFVAFYPGPAEGEGVCKLAVDLNSPEAAKINELADRIIACLRAGIPGFYAVREIARSPHVLPRDGFRLRGKYVISQSDILSGRCEGGGVKAWWPQEFWDPQKGPIYQYPPPGQPYEIPLAALQCESVTNLFAAGNGISASAEAASSTRASGICLATGAAAGELAAESVG
jgi:hypothetical protein